LNRQIPEHRPTIPPHRNNGRLGVVLNKHGALTSTDLVGVLQSFHISVYKWHVKLLSQNDGNHVYQAYGGSAPASGTQGKV
jgi:hypothetical protein